MRCWELLDVFQGSPTLSMSPVGVAKTIATHIIGYYLWEDLESMDLYEPASGYLVKHAHSSLGLLAHNHIG